MTIFLRFYFLLALFCFSIPATAQSPLEMGHAAQSADTSGRLQKLHDSFDNRIEAILADEALSSRQRRRIEKLHRRLDARLNGHPPTSQNDRQYRTGSGLLLAGALGIVVGIASLVIGGRTLLRNSTPYPALLILTGIVLVVICSILAIIGLIMMLTSSGNSS